jgi:Uma2 family endonuclease
VTPEKLKDAQRDDLTGFIRLCPDFVIELLSASDTLAVTQAKMARWRENGASLAWLIDPYQQQVYVYDPTGQVQVSTEKAVHGSGPVEGFVLDLDELWLCYQI